MNKNHIIAVILFFLNFTTLAFANDPNSEFRLADVAPKGAFTLHAENIVRNGKSIDLDITRSTANPNTYKEVNTKLNACFTKAPIEQPAAVRYQNLNYPKPPVGFEKGGVIGWVTAVNFATSPGYVLVRKMAVYEIDPNGKRYLVTDKFTCPNCDLDNQVWGYEIPKMLWSDPSAWNRPNHGSVFEVLSGNIIKIPTSNQPFDLFHLWNTTWPRKPVKPGWRYELEAEALPVGAGMIQIGIDFWTETNGGANVEAANSPWVCAKSGSNWQIIRAGGFR